MENGENPPATTPVCIAHPKQIIWPELPWRSEFKKQKQFWSAHVNINDLWPTIASSRQCKRNMQCSCQADTTCSFNFQTGDAEWMVNFIHSHRKPNYSFRTPYFYTYLHSKSVVASLHELQTFSVFYLYIIFSTQQNVSLHCFHKNLVNNPQLMIPWIISLRLNNTMRLNNILNKCPPLSTRGKGA